MEAPQWSIFNFHCPPYDTQIDQGPVLGEDMRMRSTAGGVEMHPVGSTACREVIERYQPMLGFHGHLHESRGTFKLNGQKRQIDIVGDDEAEPTAGRLAFSAPLARAMMGAYDGERVDFNGKPGAIEVLSTGPIPA